MDWFDDLDESWQREFPDLDIDRSLRRLLDAFEGRRKPWDALATT